jgi:hypothetical protein
MTAGTAPAIQKERMLATLQDIAEAIAKGKLSAVKGCLNERATTRT